MNASSNTGVMTRSEQKQQTRQRLIEATMAVIGSEGFSGVTMAKVAEKAGLYQYFGGGCEEIEKIVFHIVIRSDAIKYICHFRIYQ